MPDIIRLNYSFAKAGWLSGFVFPDQKLDQEGDGYGWSWWSDLNRRGQSRRLTRPFQSTSMGHQHICFYMIYNDANLFVFRRLQEYLTVHYDESVFSIYVVVLYPRWMPPTCYITMNKNWMKNGPSDWIRTSGIVVPNHALYHLSYTRIFDSEGL